LPISNALGVTNKLIAGVSSKDRARLLSKCEPVDLVFGDRLSEADKPIKHVYFPLAGFISLVATLDGHQPLEMGLVGNEGMLGVTLTLGIKTAPMRAVVQGSGTALRMIGSDFMRLLGRTPALSRVLDRYLYVMMAQLTRSSACTRFHQIEPRLARWLLMTHDRAHADHFHLTHEFLADMLGVRRSGVSVAAGALQLRKLIRYSRGEIRILNRKGLEAASCECYDATLKDYADALG
jgi:CRP-like cAMP-binding protein